MAVVDITNHDIKIFFRRLQVPAELVNTDLVPGSDTIGQDSTEQRASIQAIPLRRLAAQRAETACT